MSSLSLPPEWYDSLLLTLQVVAIILIAYLLQRLLSRGLTRLAVRYDLPPELVLPVRGSLRWLIMGSATIMVLERFGVSATVLWTALSGFVAVAAVAFFALWSVLSNLLCAVLIFTVGPFRLGDVIEVLDAPDKPGIKGRVSSINLLYTTLEELDADANAPLTQIPNSQFFQKTLRRWRGTEPFSLFHDREH